MGYLTGWKGPGLKPLFIQAVEIAALKRCATQNRSFSAAPSLG